MKKIVALILALATMTVMFASCGKEENKAETKAESHTKDDDTANVKNDADKFDLAEDGYLTMATNAEFPPYEYHENNEIVGIDAEIAKAIADKLGLELKIEDMKFDSIITSVTSGGADVAIAGLTVTDERKKSVDFTSSYATGVQSVIVKEGSDIVEIDDLTGKKIGVQLSTTGDIYATDDYGKDNVVQYNKGADAVLALLGGELDAVIIDDQPAKVYVQQNQGLKILDTEYVIEEYAIAVSKDNKALRDAINVALEELIIDGTVDKIISKYISAE